MYVPVHSAASGRPTHHGPSGHINKALPPMYGHGHGEPYQCQTVHVRCSYVHELPGRVARRVLAVARIRSGSHPGSSLAASGPVVVTYCGYAEAAPTVCSVMAGISEGAAPPFCSSSVAMLLDITR